MKPDEMGLRFLDMNPEQADKLLEALHEAIKNDERMQDVSKESAFILQAAIKMASIGCVATKEEVQSDIAATNQDENLTEEQKEECISNMFMFIADSQRRIAQYALAYIYQQNKEALKYATSVQALCETVSDWKAASKKQSEENNKD